MIAPGQPLLRREAEALLTRCADEAKTVEADTRGVGACGRSGTDCCSIDDQD